MQSRAGMKSSIRRFAVAAMALWAGGCVIVSEEDPPVVAQPGSMEASTLAEINAAAQLSFDNSRTSALKAIAGRAGLPESAQIHLIRTTFQRLSFENNRMTVLQALIENESFTYAAKQAVLVNISKFAFDSNRTALLQLLDKRGALKA